MYTNISQNMHAVTRIVKETGKRKKKETDMAGGFATYAVCLSVLFLCAFGLFGNLMQFRQACRSYFVVWLIFFEINLLFISSQFPNQIDNVIRIQQVRSPEQ